jgi:hypothetical protein
MTPNAKAKSGRTTAAQRAAVGRAGFGIRGTSGYAAWRRNSTFTATGAVNGKASIALHAQTN